MSGHNLYVLRKKSAPRYKRDAGIVSYLLASARTSQSQHLTTTLVEIEPGGIQRIHSHIPEQIYFILEGSGSMTVGSESEQVGPGDCVFIPSSSDHGLINDGDSTLRYFSASAPTFEKTELYEFWPLDPEA